MRENWLFNLIPALQSSTASLYCFSAI